MYKDYVDSIFGLLKRLQVAEHNGNVMDSDEGFDRWCAITSNLQVNGAEMFFVGNGASAMMASHMSADASKNGKIRAVAFNDVALVTAVSNDIAYDEVFAVPLGRMANSDDVLVTISSSGNSPNIVRAIEMAREIGLTIITLSGMREDNKSRKMGDLNFYVPAETYGMVESAHQIILHYWLDLFMNDFPKNDIE